MNPSFSTLKDILDLLLPTILALIALFWPNLQALYKRRAFTRLILRELKELTPSPREPEDGKQWWEHQKRHFVHQRIFEDVSANRDFILSLEPTLVYWVTQLWDSLESHDAEQWLWYLGNIAKKYDRRGEINKNHTLWKQLIETYSRNANSQRIE